MNATTETFAQPLKYLDQAMTKLRDLGLVPEPGTSAEAPIIALINKIADLDEDKALAIARTLNMMSRKSQQQTFVRIARWGSLRPKATRRRLDLPISTFQNEAVERGLVVRKSPIG